MKEGVRMKEMGLKYENLFDGRRRFWMKEMSFYEGKGFVWSELKKWRDEVNEGWREWKNIKRWSRAKRWS
jgi:hypothetical protein